MPQGRRSQKKSGGHGREKDGGKHGVKRGEAERQEIALAALEVDAARLGGGGKRFSDADDAQRHGNGQNLQIGRKRTQLFPRRHKKPAARKRRAYPAIRGRQQEQRPAGMLPAAFCRAVCFASAYRNANSKSTIPVTSFYPSVNHL